MTSVRIGLLGLSLGLLLAGCSSPPTQATVTGKVTYKNGPVTGGVVSFQPATGTPLTAPIKGDGAYTLTNVPFGSYKVTVTPLPGYLMTSKAPPGTPVIPEAPDAPKPMALPAKYAKVETSGLTFTAAKAEETYDIPLAN